MISILAVAATCSLGVEVTNISQRIRQDRAIPTYIAGAIVRVVRIRSPAARAGVQVGDVIQAVGDQLIQNVCGYQSAIAKRTCGDVELTIRRGNETLSIDAALVYTPSPKTGPHFSDQEACSNGDPAACTRLGREHKALDLFRLACDLGDSEGCYLLAVNLPNEHRDTGGAYRQACDDGNALACTNLGYMYQYGKGINTDVGEAVRLYQRGCDGTSCTGPNNVGCMNLGRMYLNGEGVPKDLFRSTQIFRQVCDRTADGDQDAAEIAHACSLAGTASLLGKGAVKDLQQALSLLDKGCEMRDALGCYNLGIVYDTGKYTKPDRARALTYYQRACEREDADACQRAIKLRGDVPR